MVQKIENIQENWGFLRGKNIFIACSGGLDSTLLAHLFANISNSCTLLHVNYNLRGEESIGDESFVLELGKKLNIPVKINSIQTQEILKEKRENIQLFARNFRYKWFEEFLKDKNSILLLGHHLDDQIETFYLNLARKSGNLGMACMLEKNKQILRPFLAFSKEDLKKYALSKNISWREDSSNFSNKYARNRLRNEFIPLMMEKIPSLRDSIQILINQFQKEVIEIENSIVELRDSITKNRILHFASYNSLNLEQKIALVKNFNFKASQLSEIQKLQHSSKGKILSSTTHFFINEKEHFLICERKIEEKTAQLLLEKCEKLPNKFSKNEIYVDKQKINGEISLRKWENGDRISSLGMNGTQLISDIIKDAKISTIQKQNVFIVHDEATILWCVGLKISRQVIATNNSTEIIKISVKTD
jgi:tRNA(Ile)-lysidine synthase